MKNKTVILLAATGWAMLLAISANILLYLVGTAAKLGIDSFNVAAAGGPISPILIASATLLAGLMALLSYLLLWYLTPHHAVRVFRLSSLIILLISFWSPANISGAPISMIILLDLMHLITIASINWAYTVWAHNKYHALTAS